jgi:uroporphyrinogen-III synthase
MKRILNTKPFAATERQLAQAQGWSLLEHAFIQIEPIASATLQETCRKIFAQSYQVVFTSANAVRIVSSLLEEVPSKGVVYCIQGATEAAVKNHFPYADILGVAGYGKVLADIIVAQNSVQELDFFCGNIRSNDLPQRVSQAGISLHEHTVYKTTATPTRIDDPLDGVLFYSPSGVDSFFSQNTLVDQTTCFAIGHTTAAAIQKHVRQQPILARYPESKALLEAAIDYFKTNE